MSSKRKNHHRHETALRPAASTPSPQRAPEPVTEQIVAPMPKLHESDRIGDILRRVREHREEELESISDYLRIRPDFLFALENSHYEQLPADAYVIGFLRTYAAYLGLDGRGAIDQYRREMAGRRRKPQLSMPQPMPEGRAPTFVILIAAVVSVSIIYGIWYGLSTPDETIASKPLPISEAKDPVETDSSSIILSVPAPSETVPLSETATPADPKALDQKTEPTVTEEKKEETKKIEDKKTENKKTEVPVVPVKIEAIKVEVPPPVATPAEPAKTEATPPVPAEQATTPPAEAPRVYGEQKQTHVAVRADKESWVLITDNKGVTIFERTLKAGETYNVPNGRNLNLTTGNVAGVSLLIDGTPMPRLPATGKVARGVPLDPEKLKSRLTAPLPVQPSDSQVDAATDPTASD